MIVNILVTPKAAAKHEILFNKPASALSTATLITTTISFIIPAQAKQKMTHLGLFTHAI
jgi:hypothetical protein